MMHHEYEPRIVWTQLNYIGLKLRHCHHPGSPLPSNCVLSSLDTPPIGSQISLQFPFSHVGPKLRHHLHPGRSLSTNWDQILRAFWCYLVIPQSCPARTGGLSSHSAHHVSLEYPNSQSPGDLY